MLDIFLFLGGIWGGRSLDIEFYLKTRGSGPKGRRLDEGL
jgi:hypothetical protein